MFLNCRFLGLSCCLAGLLFISSVVSAREITPASSAVKITPLQQIVTKAQREGLVSLAGAIIRNGQTEEVFAIGLRKSDHTAAVTADDAYHLGSNTKAMTASLLGLLVQEGKLRWDTTLGETFTNCGKEIHPEYQAVTLEMLVRHQGGLPHTLTLGDQLSKWDSDKRPIREQRLDFACGHLKQRPLFKPGQTEHYSNAGFIIAATVAEQVTGEDWETLITNRLFKPLGMTSAGFGPTPTNLPPHGPWPHYQKGNQIVPVENGLRDNPPFLGPAGRVHCNLADWSKFLQLHLDQPNSLLKPETKQALHQKTKAGQMAAGWIITSSPNHGRVLFHNGTNTMNYSATWLIPHKNFALLLATNQATQETPSRFENLAKELVPAYLDLPADE